MMMMMMKTVIMIKTDNDNIKNMINKMHSCVNSGYV